MKLTALLVALCLCAISHAQLTRSVYTTPQNGINRSAALTEINNQMVFASLKESSPDTLRITTAYMDDQGETSGYHHSMLIGVGGDYHSLSGLNVTSNNTLMLTILSMTIQEMSIVYVEVDPTTGVPTYIGENPMLFQAGFVRTRVNADSLITYVCTSTDLYRTAAPVDDPMAAVTTMVEPGISYNGAIVTGKKSVELMIADNGDEYAAVESDIVRKDNTGYTVGTTSSFGATINGPAMGVNSNGEVLLIGGNQYTLFDNTLNPVVESQFPVGTISTGRYSQVAYSSGSWNLYYQTVGASTSKKAVLDNGMNIITEFDLGDYQLEPYDLYERNNGSLMIIGSKREPVWMDAFSFFVMEDAVLQEPIPFLEFNQSMDHYEQHFFTGHLSNFLFRSQTAFEGGLMLEHNGREKPLIYTSSNSLLGENVSGDTVGLMTIYDQDFILPGPFTPEAYKSHESMDKHNRGFYVDKDMIEAHLWSVNNDPQYNPPFAIKHWPAHGDPALQQSQNLAPFFDQNGNGTYEPLLGDYPSIYGDRCVLNVFYQSELDSTFGINAVDQNIESLQYIFVFDCDTTEVLRNTIFVKQKFILTNSSLSGARPGIFMDSDVGYYGDDYIGTNVDLGMVYGYNGDLYDEAGNGQYGFSDTLPAVGMMVLHGAKMQDDGVDNAVGIGTNETINGSGFGDGIIDNEYYGLEGSYWKTDGTPYSFSSAQYYGAFQGQNPNGSYTQVNGVDTRHAYFGKSDPLFYSAWGQNHGNDNYEFYGPAPLGDRRIYGGAGEIDLDGTDPNANSVEILTAYITSIDTVNIPTTLLEPLSRLFGFGYQLRALYTANEAGCAANFDPYVAPYYLGLEEKVLEASIYPNPTTTEVFIAVENTKTFAVHITDINGREVYHNAAYQNGTAIPTEFWQSGIYVVNIQTENASITRKLIR